MVTRGMLYSEEDSEETRIGLLAVTLILLGLRGTTDVFSMLFGVEAWKNESRR